MKRERLRQYPMLKVCGERDSGYPGPYQSLSLIISDGEMVNFFECCCIDDELKDGHGRGGKVEHQT